MGYDLSILICHLYGRETSLATLRTRLEATIPAGAPVEILIEADAGQLSVGEKRNRLLDQARGEYVAYIDDDDMVSKRYVPEILAAIQKKPDCVGIEGVLRYRDQQYKFSHSIDYSGWYTGPDGVFYRTPNHLNPVRRDLALQVRFPPVDNGEDKDYSDRVRPLLLNEEFIEGPIYYYAYDPEKKGVAQ